MATRGKREAAVQEWRSMSPSHRKHTKPLPKPLRVKLYHLLVVAAVLVAVSAGFHFFPSLMEVINK